MREVWTLANSIIRSARQIINNELKYLGLGSAEGNILLHLLANGDFVRQEEIVDSLELSKPAISRALDGLEEKGYVSRERDLSDGRACLISLTPKARGVESELQSVYEHLAIVAQTGVDTTEEELFLTVLRRVSSNLAKAKLRAAERLDGQALGEAVK